jgi:hypothetical protein
MQNIKKTFTVAGGWVVVALFCAGAVICRGEEEQPDSISNKVNAVLMSDSLDQVTASELLLHPELPKEKFVEIIKASKGTGKIMETLSLFASSPPLLSGKFEQVLESAIIFPDSEAARYLSSNRYLEEYQLFALCKAAGERPDTELAGNLAGNLSLGGEAVSMLADVAMKNPASKLAERLAGSPLLPDKLQEQFFEKAGASPNSKLAAAFAFNKSLSPSIKDRLGAVVIEYPDTQMAQNFALNSGLSSAQLTALAEIAVITPNSLLAEGLGKNATLQDDHYSLLFPVIKAEGTSKLAQSLASNPNVTDQIYNLLLDIAKANPDNPLAANLTGAGGAASTPARVANLANLVIGDPDVPYASGITTNPLVPQEFFDAMVQSAIATPKSKLCRGFMEDVKQKRFRGTHAQKMKIIEVSLTYGGQ